MYLFTLVIPLKNELSMIFLPIQQLSASMTQKTARNTEMLLQWIIINNVKEFSMSVSMILILKSLEDFGLTFDTYFPEADELAVFILQAEQDGLDILCQCEYGQSRSAACAAAIREYFYHDGISVFADYRYYPNQMVFNKTLSALKNKEKI